MALRNDRQSWSRQNDTVVKSRRNQHLDADTIEDAIEYFRDLGRNDIADALEREAEEQGVSICK